MKFDRELQLLISPVIPQVKKARNEYPIILKKSRRKNNPHKRVLNVPCGHGLFSNSIHCNTGMAFVINTFTIANE